MSIARKIFAARVTLAADTATSVATLMRDSALHWGFESTALTTPSMDSIIGTELKFTPEDPVYVGSDSNVRYSDLGGDTYEGVLAPAAVVYALEDPGKYGLIDPNQVYLYNQSGCGVSLTFQAR